jgi:hypothetical protein
MHPDLLRRQTILGRSISPPRWQCEIQVGQPEAMIFRWFFFTYPLVMSK